MKGLKSRFSCRRTQITLLRMESGEAHPNEVERAKRHIQSCPDCAEAEAWLHSLGAAHRYQESPRLTPDLRGRTLEVALSAEPKVRPGRKPPLARMLLRWGSLPAGLALAIGLAFMLRDRPGPPVMPVVGPAHLEWSNGVEEALGRVAWETAALGQLSELRLPVQNPLAVGLWQVDRSVSDLKRSAHAPWSYEFERRLDGLTIRAMNLGAGIDSF